MTLANRMMFPIVGLAMGVAGPLFSVHAAIVVSAAGQTYTQSFNSLTQTHSIGQAWTNDSTLAGWFLFRQPAPGSSLTAYGGDNGASSVGSFYSYGITGSAERALGGLGASNAYYGSPGNPAVAGWIAAAFNNASGQDLGGFSTRFDGEQWRNGGNATSQNMVMEYGFGATLGAVSWTAAGAMFNWASKANSAAATSLNGNLASNRVADVGGTVNANWGAGSTLWLRWAEENNAGNDHGLAIDNFSLTASEPVPSAVPLPPPVALLAASMGAMGWLGLRRMKH